MTETAASPPGRRPSPQASARNACPLPALVLAVVAIAFFALPFLGLLWRAPWGDVWAILTSDSALHRAAAVAVVLAVGHRRLARVRRPAGLAAGPRQLPGPRRWSAPCAPCRWCCRRSSAGVALFFALGRRGLVGQYLDRWFGFTLPFTTAGVVVAQTFVAMPFLVHHRRGRVPPAGHPLRGRRPHARRVTVVRLPPRHPAGDPPRPRRRRRARLGPRPRRVRRDDHLRRQLPRPHPDHAARHLPDQRDQPRRGDRAQPRAHRRLLRRARRAARPLSSAVAARPTP